MLRVDRALWQQGYRRAMLLAAGAEELAAVDWLAAGIEVDRVACQRCVAAAGLVPAASEGDREGTVDSARRPLR